MSANRILFTILAASTVLLALGIGFQLVGAQPTAQTPTGISITYPGRLDDASSQSVPDGIYDFTFSSYEAETSKPDLGYAVPAGTVTGGDYQLTTLCRLSSNTASGGNYRLLNLTSSGPWGNCCCTFLPLVKR